MRERITIAAFIAALLACLATGLSILWALAAGYFLFVAYGLLEGHPLGEMLRMSLRGVAKAKNILFIFLLIGMLTALWRAAGTIPFLIYYASMAIMPSVVVLMSFLLCCLVSVLTGTAFGTAATIGVICMMIANVLGISPLLTGGAILSGCFFGDRCSPMSTSALLTSELTHTDIFDNIRLMIRSSAVPFLLSCGIFLFMGRSHGAPHDLSSIQALFARNFTLHWITALPAVLIILLSLFRINVKRTMTASILTALVIALAVQHYDLPFLCRSMLLGYTTADAQLAPMVDGGGVVSMLKVAAIVCLSSSYSGIFEGTGLLSGLRGGVARLSALLTPFGGALVTSLAAGMVACNQTLAIMLTHQLCQEVIPDEREMAITLEDTVVVISPLIPWSIAGAVPLETVGAPLSSILAACYLYLLPLCGLAIHLFRRARARS